MSLTRPREKAGSECSPVLYQFSFVPSTFPGQGAATPWDQVCYAETRGTLASEEG